MRSAISAGLCGPAGHLQEDRECFSRLDAILTILREDKPLPPSARSHPLKGGWQGYSECHIDPDWLLIFKKAPNELLLAATGTHADLFDE